MALLTPTQMSMLKTSVVTNGFGQSHPSVDALKERRRQGLRSVTPKCQCSEKVPLPRAPVSLTQMLML